MIYLNNIRTQQKVYVPNRSGAMNNISAIGVFSIRSMVDNTVYEIGASVTYESRLYYSASLTLPEGVQSGEYEYILYRGLIGTRLTKLGEGVCVIMPGTVGPSGPAYEQHETGAEWEQYDNEQ